MAYYSNVCGRVDCALNNLEGMCCALTESGKECDFYKDRNKYWYDARTGYIEPRKEQSKCPQCYSIIDWHNCSVGYHKGFCSKQCLERYKKWRNLT